MERLWRRRQRLLYPASGLTYDGKVVAPVTFPVQIYIWGRDASDRVADFNASPSATAEQRESGVEQTNAVQWTWVGDDHTGDPILCDNLTDNFFVTWPKGRDASGAEECNQRLICNTAWVTTRVGQTIVLSKSYSTGMGDLKVAIRNGVETVDGYILEDIRREMWSWQDRFLSGYTPDKAEPTGLPYVSFPYGFDRP